MGEAEYARVAGQDAMSSIRSRPGEFARNTILRMAYWWIGTPPTSRWQSRRLHALRFLKLPAAVNVLVVDLIWSRPRTKAWKPKSTVICRCAPLLSARLLRDTYIHQLYVPCYLSVQRCWLWLRLRFRYE